MNETKTNLKISSILVLVLSGFSFLRTVVDLISVDISALPEGTSEEIILIAKIAIAVVCAIILLPQIFVGVRGLKLVKNPAPGKSHIVWTNILLVVLAVSAIFNVISLFQNADVGSVTSSLAHNCVEIAVFSSYLQYALALQKEIK